MDQGSAERRETERLAALTDMRLLDTPASESFDRITRMAARLFDVPISAVSLTDRGRQWFKSHVGTPTREIPREQAPCAEVTRTAAALVVPDMLEDQRFADSPLSRNGVRFYAGAPLITRDGHALGAMCVLGLDPRGVAPDEMAALRDLAGLVMAQIELEHDFGRVDPLSGLPNRHQFADDLRDLGRAQPGAARVAVMVDLADMKQVSQMQSVLGPAYVDDLIQASSRRVKDALGRNARLYHVSVAAYLFVLEETGVQAWHDAMERLTAGLSAPILCNDIPVSLSPAFGISPFRLGEADPRDTLRTAISAAGDARAVGLAYAVYSPASDGANRRRFTLLTDMREALARDDQFRLVYQPRVDVRTRACVGAEALLRWRNPQLGNVPPGEFIPLVEQTALARPVTEWVISAALDQVAAWRARGIGLRVSVNVSANNLREPDFAQRLGEELARRGLTSEGLELELTESALIDDMGRVREQLEQLRALGIEIAIDDFGTGYSSFSYLKMIPASTVKLDQSFIRTLEGDHTGKLLVRSMVGMAHDLGFRVVAEGVETEAAFEFLAECGCEEAQGYLFSRPVEPEALVDWLAAPRTSHLLALN